MAKITFYCEGNEWVDTKIEGEIDEAIKVKVENLSPKAFGIERMDISDIDIVQYVARQKGHSCIIQIQHPDTGEVYSCPSEEIFGRRQT